LVFTTLGFQRFRVRRPHVRTPTPSHARIYSLKILKRECALFYTDFLTKGDDGHYHAFPSNQGEDGFTGNPKDYTDRSQIMRHMRYCLRAAIGAAEALGVDPELRSVWRDRLELAAPDDGVEGPELGGLPTGLAERFAPEFFAMDGGPRLPADEGSGPSPWAERTSGPFGDLWSWYFGKVPWTWMIYLRNGLFHADRDWPHVRELIERWRRPNGLLPAMSMGRYGALGGWTESLGIIGPLQEMMIQSWTGAIHLFPAWPKSIDVAFDQFRAEGAFLVSATWSSGGVSRVHIRSERGQRCRLIRPWKQGCSVWDERGRAVPATQEGNAIAFDTREGGEFEVRRA
jgi:hypothetical protein